MVAPLTFKLLHETLAVGDRHWSAGAPSHLWSYNVHYFDDLNAVDAELRREWHIQAVMKWIHAHPPTRDDAWSPFPMSLRIVNWIKWALRGEDLGPLMMDSLCLQARMLRRQLEYHLLGNHLLANAKALVFAGLFFDDPHADALLDKGLSLLSSQLPEQILPDGGQFERSTMYHALALEDLLDLINVANTFPAAIPERWKPLVQSWPSTAERMLRWFDAMSHPDGEISLFNDAAIGIAPSPAELHRYARELLGESQSDHSRLTRLLDSGYLRAEAQDAVLFTDVAPVGPDYLPGHAHADTLSFELSLFGQRTIVNGGTSRYGTGPVREAERGTPAHSTVTVNGENSSEVWAGFRVARRAKPFDLEVEDAKDEIRISCAHDGYRRLPGRPVHRRTWRLRDALLRVEDHIEGRYRTAVVRFHLHPSVEVTVEAHGQCGILKLPKGQQVRWRAAGPVRIQPSHYAPEFGLKLETHCLALDFQGSDPAWLELSW